MGLGAYFGYFVRYAKVFGSWLLEQVANFVLVKTVVVTSSDMSKISAKMLPRKIECASIAPMPSKHEPSQEAIVTLTELVR